MSRTRKASKKFSALGIISVFVLLISAAAHAQTCPDDMVSYWKLDETGTPTAFPDSSGINNNDGSCSGDACPTPDTGIISGAMNFDGNDGIDVPDHTSLNWVNADSFTIELWVNTTQTAGSTRIFIGKFNGGSNMQWWVGYTSTNTITFFLQDSASISYQIDGTTVINDGNWHHVVAIRDAINNQLLLYVDGKADNTPVSTSYTGDFIGTNPLSIGYFFNAFYYQGILDEVALYNRALSEAEIKSHYYFAQGYCDICGSAVTIMPLGDSITVGSSSGTIPADDPDYYISYRKDLWEALGAGGYDIDFVGSQTGGGLVSPPFDPNHEGHAGQGAAFIRDNIYGWLTTNPAEVILLHIGSVNINGSTTPAKVAATVAQVEEALDNIDQYETDNGVAITVILARIINRKCCTITPSCTDCQNITDFNDSLATMAQGRIDNGDKIMIVDIENGVSINYRGYLESPPEGPGDMYDGVHPYATGYAKMSNGADGWYNKLTTFLPVCGTPAPTPPEIISSSVTTATVGILYTYDVDATGIPDPTYSLTTKPPGMAIDPDTGIIEWIPDATQEGDNDVEVVVSNGVPPGDTQPFTITVSSPPTCPPEMSHYWMLESGPPYQDSIIANKNDATCINCPIPTTGIVGAAQYFDGSNDEVNVADDGSWDWGKDDSFSIEYWMKTTESTSGNRVIVARDGDGLHWWVGCYANGTVMFQLGDNNGNSTYAGNTGEALNDGIWHLVVAVRDGSTDEIRVYVDGEMIDETTYDYEADFSANTDLEIGYLSGGSHYRYHGMLDELATHDRVLTDEEILAHYNSGLAGLGFCELQCQTDEDCDDGNVCTDETCVDYTCYYINNTVACPTPNPPPPSLPPDPSSCNVVISPSSNILKSGEVLELTALTNCDGYEEEGNYQWEIISVIGSSIDAGTGLYTAGDNDTDSPVTETIGVTDTNYGAADITEVTVVAGIKEPQICEINIAPSFITLDSNESITFTATTKGEGCLEPDYSWHLDTDIHSKITIGDSSCFYQAGSNKSGILATDTITVIDNANSLSIDATATIQYGRIVSVFPNVLLNSRWIPLPHIMFIAGENTRFNATSRLTYTPNNSIDIIGQIGLDNLMIVMLLTSPNTEESFIDISVTTTSGNGEEVTFTKESSFNINLLPYTLDERETR